MSIDSFPELIQYKIQDGIMPQSADSTYFKLYFFESGAGNLQLNGNSYSLIGPCILCASELDTVFFKAEPVRVHSLIFKPELINSTFNIETIREKRDEFQDSQKLDIYWLLPFIRSSGLLLIGPSTGARIGELLSSVETELKQQQGEFWPCRSRSFFFELLNIVSTINSAPNRVDPATINDVEPDIQNVITYLNTNYHHKIAISDLTETFDINRTSLSEKFQKVTGLSIMNYLARIRIQIACLMLRDTSLPVYEIMGRVGYEDTTHFGRVFRKETGQTPSGYREENR